MEPYAQTLALFGLSLESLITIAGLVYYLVEAAKGKWPGLFLGGWRTDALGIALAFGLSWKMFYPAWEPIIAAKVICWLVPVGLFKKSKNGG